MRRVSIRLLFGSALIGGLALLWAQSAASGKPARVKPSDEEGPAPLPLGDKLMGTASCASMSCHNVNGPRGTKRSEYSTWTGFDKHARAYHVLYEDRSERIARILYGKDANAYEQQLCLNCHSMKHEKSSGDRVSLSDGVSCESCHGPAERWLSVHYQTGFKEKSVEEKAEAGLWPTKNLAGRARICGDCHIGNVGKGMEVNHDLIAAGHPRLNFEYSGYLHMVARHWYLADDKARYPDFHARAWAIGQAVTAQTAVAQLHDRALAANKPGPAGKPWPEFAEYDCFACHKDLKVDSPRQKAGYQGRFPGSLPYGTWYLALTSNFAKESGFSLDQPDTSVKKLKQLMQKPGAPAGPVAAHAKNVLDGLDRWITFLGQSDTLTAADVRKLLQGVSADGAKRAKELDWDETAQLYLALAALNEGLADLDGKHKPDAITKDLRELGERLKKAFPPGYDSPRLFDPLRAPTLDAQFNTIRTHLGN